MIRLKNASVFLTLCLFHISIRLLGQNIPYYFHQLSSDQGLSSSNITSIFQNSEGDLWIGTQNGLNHFNGYQLKKHYYSSQEKNSIPSNSITAVTEFDGKVIIATNKGAVAYNKDKNTFIPILIGNSQIIANKFCHTEKGLIFLTRDGFYHYYSNSYQCERIFSPRQKVKHKSYFNEIIKIKKANTFMLSTPDNGIWQINPYIGAIEKVTWYPHKTVGAMCLDKTNGSLWIATLNKGIYNYTPEGILLAHYHKDNSVMGHNLVLSLNDQHGKIWIGTNGHGIYTIDKQSKLLSALQYNAQTATLAKETINCFSKGSQDFMWAGSLNHGVFFLKKSAIYSYTKDNKEEHFGLSSEGVNCLYKESEEKVWLGTEGGGINLFDVPSRTFQYFSKTNELKVVSIVPYDQNHLLLSAYPNLVYKFHKQTGQLSAVSPALASSLEQQGNIINTVRHGDKIYFFGNINIVFNIKTQQVKQLLQFEGLYPSHIRSIAQNDTCAYLTSKRAFYQLDFRNDMMEQIYAPRLHGDFITTASMDTLGNYWFNIGYQLSTYNIHTQKETLIEDLSEIRINSLQFNHEGNIWIGAEGKLLLYKPKERSFQSYNTEIGYAPNIFNPKAVIQVNHGDILMGGNFGLLYIPADIKEIDMQKLTLRISKMSVNGSLIHPIYEGRQFVVDIPYHNNAIQIALRHNSDFLLFKHKFRYKIDEGNSLPLSDNILTINSLSYGKHILKVSYSTIDGRWSPYQEVAIIHVASPWWLRWYTLLFVSLLICGIMVLILLYDRHRKNQEYKAYLHQQQKDISEQKINFLTNINHELRTPLTLMYAPLMQISQQTTEGSELHTSSVLALNQARRMKRIVDMILDIKKLDHNDELLQKSEVQINEWLHNFLNDFEYQAQTRNIQLVRKLDPKVTSTEIDMHKMELAIINLLSNAFKFSPNNAIIEVCTKCYPTHFYIGIKDEGTGIQGDKNQLFEDFYQEAHSKGGTGLGLSYAKRITRLHNGKIGCKNNDTGGATFWVELPIIGTHNPLQTSLDKTENKVYQSVDLKASSIIIVEDEYDIRKILEDEFRPLFHTVYTASNGAMALDLILEHQPNIIISDINMPEMDGLQLCQAVKSHPKVSHTPIILLTAFVGDENKLMGYKAGADHYIHKPFEMEYLLILIQKTLFRQQQQLKDNSLASGYVDAKSTTTSAYDETFLNNLNELIRHELSNPELNVNFISKQLGISRTSLYNKMKNIVGIGVNDYVIRIRIKEACILLRTTDKPIIEIANTVGFNDQRYFSTTFKGIQQMTPTQYRKQELPLITEV